MQAQTSNIKKVLKKLGIPGSTEETILPKAMEPVKKVRNLIENIPI